MNEVLANIPATFSAPTRRPRLLWRWPLFRRRGPRHGRTGCDGRTDRNGPRGDAKGAWPAPQGVGPQDPKVNSRHRRGHPRRPRPTARSG